MVNARLPYKSRFAPGFDTESLSADRFDSLIEGSGLFRKVYREVRGYYLSRKPMQVDREPRIDRILIPGPILKRAGWKWPLGVEIKASSADVGHAICQAMDYAHAAFDLDGSFIWLQYVFLFPFAGEKGTVASIMAQNRIGSAACQQDGVRFFFPDACVIDTRVGAERVAKAPPAAGRKKGSR